MSGAAAIHIECILLYAAYIKIYNKTKLYTAIKEKACYWCMKH